jgi:hypothetical protein
VAASKFRKGEAVRVVQDQARSLRDLRGLRYYTEAERAELRASPAYMGLDDGGEPRLAPVYCWVRMVEGAVLHVLRARARPPHSSSGPAWVLTLDARTGHEIYIRQDCLEHLTGSP